MTVLHQRATAGEMTAKGSGPEDVLEVSDLTVRFQRRGGELTAVNGLSYSVRPGETLAIIGESGSGKTVAARAVMGLLPESAHVEGSIRYEGKELVGRTDAQMRSVRGREVAMVFQNPARALDPTMRVGTQIMEVARKHLQLSRRAAQAHAVGLLRRVQLPDANRRIHEYPHQFSGGMLQRVMIATAIACNPKVLIADEATTALDVTTQAQVMELLLELQCEFGMALIIISHDLGLAASYADEVLVMYAGQAVEQAPTRELFQNMQMHYTRALLDAVPRLDAQWAEPGKSVGGQPPDLSLERFGCPFAPRCQAGEDDCFREVPPLREESPSHRFACWHPLGGAVD